MTTSAYRHNAAMSRTAIEIETPAELADHVARGSLRHCWVQSVDLAPVAHELSGQVEVAGAVFLGCPAPDGLAERLRAAGALVFPELPQLPVNPYRSSLYTAAELYGTDGYAASPDAVAYAWTRRHLPVPGIAEELAMALHDHAVTDALGDLLDGIEPDRLVGIMGGHAVARDDPAYREAALLSRHLTRSGKLVLTGGGPGAMEAANLGARLAGLPDGALDDALARLGTVPGFRPSVDAWAGSGFDLLAALGDGAGGRSVAIPTWFYGHEPPNVFATDIAKYFTNAIREDVLLRRCRGGICYLPGAAGTVQEVFQAVTGNYYAEDEAEIAPLVLVGEEHWTQRLPVWPLLQALGRDRAMGRHVHLVPDAAAAGAILLG